MRNVQSDLEEVIKFNIEDSKKLVGAAEESGDLDTLEKALEDLQRWQDKAGEMGLK